MAEDLEQQVDGIFESAAKVYCGTCYWYVPLRETRYGLMEPECRHRNALQTQENYEGVTVVRISPEMRNKRNDCADWRQRTFYIALRYDAFLRGVFLCAAVFGLVWLWGVLTR